MHDWIGASSFATARAWNITEVNDKGADKADKVRYCTLYIAVAFGERSAAGLGSAAFLFLEPRHAQRAKASDHGHVCRHEAE